MMLVSTSKSGAKDVHGQMVNSITILVRNPMWPMTELHMILVQ